MSSISRSAARYHGDQAAAPGMLHFAVDVRSAAPPSWLVERLGARLGEPGRYPSDGDTRRAVGAVAARHGRPDDEVAPLAGGAEGFALLAPAQHLRAAVRPEWTVLIDAMVEVTG